MHDVRYALRMFLKRRGFSAAVVVTFALGIGANTAVFSLVDAVMLKPLPYKTAPRLLQIEERHAGGIASSLTYATLLDVESSAHTLEHVAAYRTWQFNMTGRGEPQRVSGARVSSGFFPALGTSPALGRAFVSSDDRAGSDDVVILSDALWRQSFGAQAGAIGSRLELNDVSYTIVGVMPPGFDFPPDAGLWVPLAARGPLAPNRRAHLLTTIGCLRPGVSLEAARADLALLGADIVRAAPGVDEAMTLGARTLQDRLTSPVRPTLRVILGVVAGVLLIAMVNVAHLLLARVLDRRRELAVRLALGAPRGRLVALILSENLMLAGAGGCLGVTLAWAGLRAVSSAGLSALTGTAQVTLDWRVIAFAIALTSLTGLLSGLPPAIQVASVEPADTLRRGGRGIHGGVGGRLTRALIVAETASSLALVSATGLLLASLLRLQSVDPGFNADRVLTLNVFLPGGEPVPGRAEGLFVPALGRIRAIPGVLAASLVNVLPTEGAPSTGFVIEKRAEDQDVPVADIGIVDADYFRTLGIPLIRGRLLDGRDSRDRMRAVVVSEALARRYFVGADPIGQGIVMKDWGPPLSAQIVGVVGDVHDRGLAADAPPMIYWSYQQFPSSFNTIVVRTAGDPVQALAEVKAAIWSVDPRQPISSVRRLDDLVAASLAQRRFSLWLLGAFAALALALSAIGVYGVLSHAVGRRAAEIGVRLALGAQPSRVFGLVMADGLGLIAWGIGTGLFAALAAARLLRSLLFDTSTTDLPVLTAGVALALVAGTLACAVPARRAVRIDPIDALRAE